MPERNVHVLLDDVTNLRATGLSFEKVSLDLENKNSNGIDSNKVNLNFTNKKFNLK